VLAWALLPLVALHVAGVLYTSRRKSERLVASMLTGNKPPPSGDDVA